MSSGRPRATLWFEQIHQTLHLCRFQRLFLSDTIFQQGGWRYNIFVCFCCIFVFFQYFEKLWFQQVHNMLRLCMFPCFPRVLAVWDWFCVFMYFWFIFHILRNVWFKQVHQTLRLCMFQRFSKRMWTWTFGLPGAPWGHFLEAIFTRRYACAGLRVSGTQREPSCINSPGLSFRLSKD